MEEQDLDARCQCGARAEVGQLCEECYDRKVKELPLRTWQEVKDFIQFLREPGRDSKQTGGPR